MSILEDKKYSNYSNKFTLTSPPLIKQIVNLHHDLTIFIIGIRILVFSIGEQTKVKLFSELDTEQTK